MTEKTPKTLLCLLSDAVAKHRAEDEKHTTRRESPELYQQVVNAISNGTIDGIPLRLYDIALIFSITAATEGRTLESVEKIMDEYGCTKQYTALMYHLNNHQNNKRTDEGRTPSKRFAQRYEEVPEGI